MVSLLQSSWAKASDAESGGATRRHRDHAHVALTIFVDGVRNPVGQAAIRSEPVVRSALGPAAHHGHARFSKTFLTAWKVVFGNLGVGVHQADVVIAPDQFEHGSKAGQAVRLPNVLFVSCHVHTKRTGDVSSAVTGAVINDVHIRGQQARPQNAAQRSSDAYRLIFRRQHYAKPFHN